ncbi:hypothetical protein HWV62_21726 [Athelia sp. TMB]|nr:hypothetical protein HWV62_21726 [Athelia sp. TMB]
MSLPTRLVDGQKIVDIPISDAFFLGPEMDGQFYAALQWQHLPDIKYTTWIIPDTFQVGSRCKSQVVGKLRLFCHYRSARPLLSESFNSRKGRGPQFGLGSLQLMILLFVDMPA